MTYQQLKSGCFQPIRPRESQEVNSNQVKPIETVYKGYRFRSRTEARWAVFFERVSLQFEYELEGYDLGDCGYYLPDFWLPDFRCWVEIKPDTITDDVDKKMRAFADGVGPITCFVGSPSPSWSGKLYCHDLTDSTGGSYTSRIGAVVIRVCNTIAIGVCTTHKLA
jgi:hypothetical protein